MPLVWLWRDWVRERRPYLTCYLCVLAATLAACRTVRESEVPGTYLERGDWGDAKMILRPDHTMRQVVALRSGSAETQEGTWEFHGDHILLKPCIVLKLNAPPSKAGLCSYSVSGIGSDAIEITVDRGIVFVK